MTNPLTDRTLTVCVMERTSPLPPVYPDPLLYTVTLPAAAFTGLARESQEALILDAVAEQRADDLEVGEDDLETLDKIRAGLVLQFAFEGDITTAFDWR